MLRVGSLNVTAWASWAAAASQEQDAAQVWLLQEHKLTNRAEIKAAKLDIATSNLRGAWFPTFIGGAQVERNIVLGPVSGTAMNVTAMSTDGRFEIGMVIDPAAVTDPSEFQDHVATAFAGLLTPTEA